MSDITRQVERLWQTTSGFGTGQRLVIAVSGGIDSVVLLHVMSTLASNLNLSLIAATVDHGLRPFEKEKAVIGEFCRSHGIPWKLLGLAPGIEERARLKTASIEMQCRVERYEALQQLVAQESAAGLVLAHNADDQVETAILALLRGTGIQGLGGMRRVRDGAIWRPFLEVSREAITTYAARHELSFVEDPTNAEDGPLRNRIRHAVMPSLGKLESDAVLKMARSCRVIGEERDAVSTLLDAQLELAGECTSQRCDLSVDGLSKGPLRRLLLHRLLHRMAPYPPEEKHLRLLDELLDSTKGSASISLPFGLEATREYNRLILTRSTQVEDGIVPLRWRIPTEERFQVGAWVLTVHFVDRVDDLVLDEKRAWVSVEDSAETWQLRGAEPSERVTPFGMEGSRLVSDILVDAKVPKGRRREVPILVDTRGRVLWIVGIKRTNERLVRIGEAGWLVSIETAR